MTFTSFYYIQSRQIKKENNATNQRLLIPKNRIKKSFAKNLALPAQLRVMDPIDPDLQIRGGQVILTLR